MSTFYYVVYFPVTKEYLSESLDASLPTEAKKIYSLDEAKELAINPQYNSFLLEFLILRLTQVSDHEFVSELIYQSPPSEVLQSL